MPSQIDKGKSPSAAGESPAVDPTIWKALANKCLEFPSAGSSVYYFPYGHAEQCDNHQSPPGFVSVDFLCRLAAINFYADPATEQVFATFNLTSEFSSPATKKLKAFSRGFDSVAKTLTKRETSCKAQTFLWLPENARSVFGFSRPGDDVDVYDLNNQRWTFGHMVAESPARHVLTHGWNHFVSSKLLVAGDTVVFIRDDDGTIFVGCRRCGEFKYDLSGMNIESSSRQTMKRLLKKREEVEMVIEAMRWADEGGEGMVEGRYYPDTNLPIYVVEKEVVENSLKVEWQPGMRVIKKRETNDGLIVWAIGILNGISPESNYTSWRMLEVIWDESCKKTYENPWEVIPVSITTSTQEEESKKLSD